MLKGKGLFIIYDYFLIDGYVMLIGLLICSYCFMNEVEVKYCMK